MTRSIQVGGYFLLLIWAGMVGVAAPVHSEDAIEIVRDGDAYFPDRPGNEWRYRGTMTQGGMVQITMNQFVNVSTVVGEDTIEGVQVIVYHDSNPGDQGPSDSYYRRDAAGIRYYGSKPGTVLEKQLVPYQIVRFPIEIPSSFQQLNRENLDLGLDLDRDGESERVDVRAKVFVRGRESLRVPFGTFQRALRLEARMVMDVHLSESRKTVRGTDTMTAWFGRGVGLLKYVERQTIPSLRSDTDRVIEVIEELESATLHEDTALLSRGETSPQGVFRDDFLDHELFHISRSTRFSSYP